MELALRLAMMVGVWNEEALKDSGADALSLHPSPLSLQPPRPNPRTVTFHPTLEGPRKLRLRLRAAGAATAEVMVGAEE